MICMCVCMYVSDIPVYNCQSCDHDRDAVNHVGRLFGRPLWLFTTLATFADS